MDHPLEREATILAEAIPMDNKTEPFLYELDESQLVYLFNKFGVKPESGSPLTHCIHQQPVEITDGISSPPAEAIQCLTQPERVFAVSNWPPEEAPVRWYYGRFDQPYLVQHDVTEDGRQLLFWPVSHGMVTELLSIPMIGHESDIAAGDFSITTNRDGMVLLAALSDALQEQSLQGQIQRTATINAPLSSLELRYTLEKTIVANDLHWTGARFSRLSPINFSVLPKSLEPAINIFIKDRLIRSENEGYRPTSQVAVTCMRWNDSDAFSAVTERKRKNNGEWDWHHHAYLHSAGGMFVFDFTDITMDDYKVWIREIGAQELQEKIVLLIFRETIINPSMAPVPIAGDNVNRCPKCGAELKPGAKFCTQCGAKILMVNQDDE